MASSDGPSSSTSRRRAFLGRKASPGRTVPTESMDGLLTSWLLFPASLVPKLSGLLRSRELRGISALKDRRVILEILAQLVRQAIPVFKAQRVIREIRETLGQPVRLALMVLVTPAQRSPNLRPRLPLLRPATSGSTQAHDSRSLRGMGVSR